MAKKYYTEKQLVSALITLARNPSSYKNKPPWNLLYWDGSRFWADCVNLYKALFNGRDITNKTYGSFQANLSNTGDVTEWGLLSQCEGISQNFAALGNNFECLYKDGHFGGYLGFEWNEPGQGIVNSVESTPAWEDGIQFSYVDSAGRRYWCKGGSQGASWTHHGKPTAFIDYSEKAYAGLATGETPMTTPTTEPTTPTNQTVDYTTTIAKCMPVIAKGSNGDMVKVLQTILKELGYYSALIDGDCGNMTVAAIKAAQTAWGITADGSFGPVSWANLITH